MIGTSCFWRHETTIPLGSETFAILMAYLFLVFPGSKVDIELDVLKACAHRLIELCWNSKILRIDRLLNTGKISQKIEHSILGDFPQRQGLFPSILAAGKRKNFMLREDHDVGISRRTQPHRCGTFPTCQHSKFGNSCSMVRKF